MWTAGFGLSFSALTLASFDGVDMMLYIFHMTGIDGKGLGLDVETWPTWAVNGVIAVEMNEILEPLRLPLVLTTTPAVARALRGYRSRAGGGENPSQRRR